MASLSKKIAFNTLAQMVGKLATTTLGVIITILLTRYLGPAGFGTYTFILVFVAMFGSVADWGMSLITVREASRNQLLAKDIIGNALVVRLLLSILAAIVATMAIFFWPSDSTVKTLVAVSSLSLIALSLKTSFQIIFNVKLQMQNSAIADFSCNVFTLLIVSVVIVFNLGLTGVVYAYLIGNFVAAGVAAYLGFKLTPLNFKLFSPQTKNLLLESLPMGAILIVFTIYNRVDTVILSYFKGQEAVGLYGAAYRIFEVLVLGAAYFANAVLPLISNLAQTDKNKLVEVYRKSFVVLMLLGTSVALITFLFAPLGVAIIAGEKFAGSVTALRILSLALITAYFNHLNGFTLIALGKQWYSFGIAIFALAVNITLNFMFIPYYSYHAAAFITFITEGLIVICDLLVLNHLIGLTISWRDFPKVVKEIFVKKGKIFEYA